MKPSGGRAGRRGSSYDGEEPAVGFMFKRGAGP